MRRSSHILSVILAILFAATLCVWIAAIRTDTGGKMQVSFLNVGQGDSIYIRAPSGRTVLIDGGPDASVLRALAHVSPWWDHSIDVVIATHPDADHIAGLMSIFERYHVGFLFRSSVNGTTDLSDSLIAEVQKTHTRDIVAQRGQIINLGDGAYLEVLWPDRPLPNVDTNTACVVTKLVYGATSFLLPCDAPQAIEKELVRLDGAGLHADILKAGHHGSKNSSAPLFIGFVNPTTAVFSRSCNNKYGFPATTTVATFKAFGIPTRDTCIDGTVTFTSDGKTVTLTTI